MFVEFRENIKKLSVKKLHGAHIKPICFGNTNEIIDYLECKDEKHKKDNVTYVLIDEQGEYKYMEFQSENKIKSARDLLGIKRLSDIPDWKMVNAWKTLKIDANSKITVANWNKPINVYWIQGPSAIGKSAMAKDMVKDWYEAKGITDEDDMSFDEVKYNHRSGFFLGIDIGANNKAAIFDDFRARMLPEDFINLIDYRRHKIEIKGGHWINNYELIIFTSVQRFHTIYGNVDDYENRRQWERRVKVIDLYTEERIPVRRPDRYRYWTERGFNELVSNDDSIITIDDGSDSVIIH